MPDVQSGMFKWLLLCLVFAFACPASEPDNSEETSGTEEEIVIQPDPEPEDTANLNIGDDACETDADCVRATCCHATACVHVDNAPDCTDMSCTADCQYGTTDCGGGCLCHEGRCTARLSEAPEMP